MKRFCLLNCLTGLFIVLITARPGNAQSSTGFLYLGNPVYDYVDYQITAGKITPDFVLRQPYSAVNLRQNEKNDRIARYFLQQQRLQIDRGRAIFFLEPENAVKFQDGIWRNRYGMAGAVHYAGKHVLLANQTALRQEYKYDPLYAGDLSESSHWLYGRVNIAYMFSQWKPFQFFIGKMKRNWGPVNDFSLILSNNPYSYNHISFGYRQGRLALSVIFARLEDLAALGFYPENTEHPITYYPRARKFFVGHRLDIRLHRNFQLGLTETATYGGPDRDMELEFLNPMIFYYGLQRNDGRLNNGKWAADIFWRFKKGWTIYGQFMIDDIIVNNEPGQNDRARYPDRLALQLSMRQADWLLPGLYTSLAYARVWNQTYLSRWTYENYHYRGLGLGYPCASCEEIKLRFYYWRFFPFYLKNETIWGQYGNVQLTDLFETEKESFPVPPVQRNILNRLTIVYFWRPSWQFYFNWQIYKNPEHYLNRLNEGARYTVSIGFQVLLSMGISME